MNIASHLGKFYLLPKGRITRREYALYGVLPFILISLAMGLWDKMTYEGRSEVWGLLLLWPMICLNTKRLHDIGKTGWSQCITFLPIIAALIFVPIALAVSGLPGSRLIKDLSESELDILLHSIHRFEGWLEGEVYIE